MSSPVQVLCEYYQLIDQDDHRYVYVEELWSIFSTTFRCCSHKCLYGKADPAALIDTFQLVTSDGMTCRGKIAPCLGETFFQF